uniref:Uncharacterized protein n=1 Tax=Phyllostachys edulis TaxID=38705 RepID=D3IVQ2_PHYED|nr:hypothetical protein [Phyllostachys edulis]
MERGRLMALLPAPGAATLVDAVGCSGRPKRRRSRRQGTPGLPIEPGLLLPPDRSVEITGGSGGRGGARGRKSARVGKIARARGRKRARCSRGRIRREEETHEQATMPSNRENHSSRSLVSR